MVYVGTMVPSCLSVRERLIMVAAAEAGVPVVELRRLTATPPLAAASFFGLVVDAGAAAVAAAVAERGESAVGTKT